MGKTAVKPLDAAPVKRSTGGELGPVGLVGPVGLRRVRGRPVGAARGWGPAGGVGPAGGLGVVLREVEGELDAV